MSSEAARLGLLPRLGVRHTSKSEGGQIYIPEVNWTLFIGVLALILIFQTSSKLATAYGLAVTGTFLLTTSLFLVLAHRAWHWPMWALIFFGVIVGGAITYYISILILRRQLTHNQAYEFITANYLPLCGAIVQCKFTLGLWAQAARKGDVEEEQTTLVGYLRVSSYFNML